MTKFITPLTLIEILDNPLAKESQLFKAQFGILVGLNGISQKFSIQLKENLINFISKNV